MFKSSDFNPNAGNNVPKIINPGTHLCRVVDVKLDAPSYKKEAYFIVLTLEGPDRGPEFVGLPIDKMNPSLGNYKGQIGNVRSGRYPFSDYVYEGRDISRDEQMFRWINNLAKQLGVFDAMNAGNGIQAATIEEYVDAVRKFITAPGLWAQFTVAGQEYFTEGYDRANYRLFFPKQEGKLLPYSALEDAEGNPVNLLPYNAAKHIIVKVEEPAQTVTEFGGQAAGIPANDMFNLNAATPIANNTFAEGGTAPATLNLPS
jgi:hypothetical protein